MPEVEGVNEAPSGNASGASAQDGAKNEARLGGHINEVSSSDANGQEPKKTAPLPSDAGHREETGRMRVRLAQAGAKDGKLSDQTTTAAAPSPYTKLRYDISPNNLELTYRGTDKDGKEQEIWRAIRSSNGTYRNVINGEIVANENPDGGFPKLVLPQPTDWSSSFGGYKPIAVPQKGQGDAGSLKGETYFMGGAGDNGDYKGDFVRAFKDAGMYNVKATNPPFSMAPNAWYGFLLDASAGVTSLNNSLPNGPIPMYMSIPSVEKRGPAGDQYNLVGYSWGSVSMAQHAIYEADVNKRQVDNLVLIGSPLNQDLVERLATTKGIRNVIYMTLTDKGDPIYPGISDAGLMASAPTLVGQMPSSSGHFYYSGNDAEGAKRRDELAKRLYELGLR